MQESEKQSSSITPTDNSRKPGPEKKFWIDSSEYELRKVLPPRLRKEKNDVYISRKTDFKAQEGRCMKLLDSEYEEIFIHGLGAAVNRAINLALQLERKYLGMVELETETSTLEVTDQLLPLLDDLEAKSRSRFISAVHIRLYKKID